jgi:hypothetical protein
MNDGIDLKRILIIVLDNQVSIMIRQLDADAQLHALQIALISLVPEHNRLQAAQGLVQTFDEQRALRKQALEQALQQLALLRVTVSTMVQ